MVGVMDCPGLFEDEEFGYVMTREMVMVANMINEEGGFEMNRDHDGWMRTQTTSRDWLSDTSGSRGDDKQRTQAIVDYRIAEPGIIQVQWARLGPWVSEHQTSRPSPKGVAVEHRVTYDVRYAVAEVT